MNFPKPSVLRANANEFHNFRTELRRKQLAPERMKKISEMMLRASQSGRNYVNVQRHWMTDDMRKELEENGMQVYNRIRTYDRAEDDHPVSSIYVRITW
jgi:hypothetical protein